MAGRKSDFTLTKLDDLFTTQAQRDEEQLSKIRDIPLELIDDFPDHPFKVRDDEDMMQLVESVKERGVITPATVRQKEDGRYELVSGHRRKRACELAGFETLRSEIVDLNRDEATILMVESNFQRSEILDKDIIPMPDDFDIENYTKEVFFMFSGEKVLVDLRCDNSLMKTMVDRFGEDVTTLAYDMTSFRVQTEVSASPTFFGWVFGFNGKVQILAPESVKGQYRQMIAQADEGMQEKENKGQEI